METDISFLITLFTTASGVGWLFGFITRSTKTIITETIQ